MGSLAALLKETEECGCSESVGTVGGEMFGVWFTGRTAQRDGKTPYQSCSRLLCFETFEYKFESGARMRDVTGKRNRTGKGKGIHIMRARVRG